MLWSKSSLGLAFSVRLAKSVPLLTRSLPLFSPGQPVLCGSCVWLLLLLKMVNTAQKDRGGGKHFRVYFVEVHKSIVFFL